MTKNLIFIVLGVVLLLVIVFGISKYRQNSKDEEAIAKERPSALDEYIEKTDVATESLASRLGLDPKNEKEANEFDNYLRKNGEACMKHGKFHRPSKYRRRKGWCYKLSDLASKGLV